MIEKFPVKFEYDQVVLLEDKNKEDRFPSEYVVFGFLNKLIPVGTLAFGYATYGKRWEMSIYVWDESSIVCDVEKENLRILLLTGKTIEEICTKAQEMYEENLQKYNLYVEIHNNFATIFGKCFNLLEEKIDQMFKHEFRRLFQFSQLGRHLAVYATYSAMVRHMVEYKIDASMSNSEEVCLRVKKILDSIDWEGPQKTYKQVRDFLDQIDILAKEIKICQ